MELLYTALLYLIQPLVWLRLLLRSRKAPAYRKRWKERYGFCQNKVEPGGILLHSVSVGETLAAIPLVGVVMLLIWAFGGNTNPNKANWAKASLIWAVIMMVIYFVFMAMFGAALLAGMGGMR